ncbi:MAG: SCP2 sterol-binding domain-containing protein [Cellvibrio sp.]|nr:SCP2 sterol-binding domain-containing protein [Cellvibrio sp.]
MINMLTSAGLVAAEKCINKSLQYDPATQNALTACEGKILSLQITAPAIKIAVLIQEKSIRLMSQWDGEVDTQLSGSMIALAQIAQTPVHNLKDSGVTVMGDLQFLAHLQKIVQQLDIDWEEMLTQIFGDLIGHQMAQTLRSKINWTQNRAKTAQRLASEFVTEELQAIPSTIELKEFYRQVDELRLAVDRLGARFNNL